MNSGGAWISCPTAIGRAWIHMSSPAKTSKLVDQEHLLLLFLLVLAVDLTVTCKAAKKNTNSIFHFCFPFFLDLPLSPFFFWGSMPPLLIVVLMVEDGIRSCRGW
jgi:hypothetical protein